MSAAAGTDTCNKSRTIYTIPDGVSLRSKTLARQQAEVARDLRRNQKPGTLHVHLAHTRICRTYCDPFIVYGKQFVAGLTSEARRAALVKLFQFLGCGLVHPK